VVGKGEPVWQKVVKKNNKHVVAMQTAAAEEYKTAPHVARQVFLFTFVTK